MTRLLLDFGGVVIRTPFELLEAVGDPPWRGPFDPASDELWRQVQAGSISERTYWDRRARELFGGDDPLGSLMRALFDQPEEVVVRPEMAAFLRQVDRPAVLTNDLARFHSPDWIAGMTVTGLFDPLIDLSFDAVRKPDPRAFRAALERLGEEPGEVLFADDQRGNLAGAGSAGMRTEWFDVTDVPGSVARIRRALGGTGWAKPSAS